MENIKEANFMERFMAQSRSSSLLLGNDEKKDIFWGVYETNEKKNIFPS